MPGEGTTPSPQEEAEAPRTGFPGDAFEACLANTLAGGRWPCWGRLGLHTRTLGGLTDHTEQPSPVTQR